MEGYTHELSRPQELLLKRILKWLKENPSDEIDEHTISVVERIVDTKSHDESTSDLLNALTEWWNYNKNK